MVSRSEPPVLSRRAFLVTTGAAFAAAACDDDIRGPALDADGAAPLMPETVAPSDAAPETAPPADVDVDTGVAGDVGPDLATPDVPPPPEVFDPAAIGTAPDPVFPVGVQSGDPLPDRILLQTRYLGAASLELVVFGVGVPAEVRDAPGDLFTRFDVTPADGGFVHVDVSGLPPGAVGRYCFVAGQVRSPVGRFSTPLRRAEGTRVVLGATSCAKLEFAPFQVLEQAATAGLDAMLLLGDTVYADDARTRDDYRTFWQQNLSRYEMQALFRSCPVIATWDDHEVDNNWDPEDFNASRLEAARGAFFEHLALRRDPVHPDRIWRSFRFGRLVEVFVLDLRSERRPSTRDGADARYVSPEQLAWLVDGGTASTATFKVIATPIPIGAYPPAYLGTDQRWQGYPAQRTALLDAIASVSGVVFVAGDFHFGAVTRVDPPSGPHHALQEVLVGPIAHVNPALTVIELTGDRAQYPFLTASRNFGRFVAELGQTRATFSVEHIGPGGEVIATHILHDLPR